MKKPLLLLILFISIIQIFSETWLVGSDTHPGRFRQIWWPSKDVSITQGRVFKTNILLAPKTYYSKIDRNAIDLCQNTSIILQRLVPEIFGEGISVNPCRDYFCSVAPPLIFPQNDTGDVIDNTLDLYTNAQFLHKMVHNLCTRCESTVNERFDLFLVNNTCPWFDRDACVADYCPTGVPCFYFHSRNSVCYTRDNTYMAKADFFHYFFVRLSRWGYGYFYFLVNLVLLSVNFFCVLGPEMAAWIRNYRSIELTALDKFKIVFGLRNQSTFVEIIFNMAYVIAGLIDILNFSSSSATGIVLYLHFAAVLHSWALLIILWWHIHNQSEDSGKNLSTILKVAWCVITFGGLTLAVVAITLLIISSATRGIFAILVLIVCLLCVFAFLLFVVACFLVFISLKIMLSMERPKDAAQFGFYLFKLKLTRSIVFFCILLVPTVFFTITAAISIMYPDFLSVYFALGVQSPVNCLLALCFSVLTCFTLIHNDNFRKCYHYKEIKD